MFGTVIITEEAFVEIDFVSNLDALFDVECGRRFHKNKIKWI